MARDRRSVITATAFGSMATQIVPLTTAEALLFVALMLCASEILCYIHDRGNNDE